MHKEDYSDFEILRAYDSAKIPSVKSKNAPAMNKILNASSTMIYSLKCSLFVSSMFLWVIFPKSCSSAPRKINE
jgi:hypothetical protein